MRTIKELKRDIEIERKKLKGIHTKKAMEIERRRLKKELFELKHRTPITLGQKGISYIKKAAKKAKPIITKQIKLIEEQQLRDEAIEKHLKKKRKVKKRIHKKGRGESDLGIFEPLDF